jgi:hypothetical protein
MHRNFKRENRETPVTSQRSFFDLWERSENASGGTADMHVTGESDDFVVPTKWANKAGTPAAESMEERKSLERREATSVIAPDTELEHAIIQTAWHLTACKDGNILTVNTQGRSRMR